MSLPRHLDRHTDRQTDRPTQTDRQTAKLGDGLEDTRTRIKCEVVDVSRCYTLQISTVETSWTRGIEMEVDS